MSGEYLLIGGSRDGQRITTERYYAVLELPMERNSYPETEVYRAMAISGENEESIVYRCSGITTDRALYQLISGYQRGDK